MDIEKIEKWIRDRKNEHAREEEISLEEHKKKTEEKEKDIEAMRGQANILDKFIRETVRPCFRETEKVFRKNDFPCGIKIFPGQQIGSVKAIQITFSPGSMKSEMDHDTWPHLKYEGYFRDDDIGIEREYFLHPSIKPEYHSFPIDFLSSPGMIDNHIEYLLDAMK
jgi:hypothetical protein